MLLLFCLFYFTSLPLPHIHALLLLFCLFYFISLPLPRLLALLILYLTSFFLPPYFAIITLLLVLFHFSLFPLPHVLARHYYFALFTLHHFLFLTSLFSHYYSTSFALSLRLCLISSTSAFLPQHLSLTLLYRHHPSLLAALCVVLTYAFRKFFLLFTVKLFFLFFFLLPVLIYLPYWSLFLSSPIVFLPSSSLHGFSFRPCPLCGVLPLVLPVICFLLFPLFFLHSVLIRWCCLHPFPLSCHNSLEDAELHQQSSFFFLDFFNFVSSCIIHSYYKCSI